LRSVTFFPKGAGNWEQMSHGEEDDFFLVFALSSRSRKGFSPALPDYKRVVGTHNKCP